MTMANKDAYNMISVIAFNSAVKSFGLALVPNDSNKLDVNSDIVEIGLKAGYIADPDAYSLELRSFFMEEAYNPNCTFYKSFEDVVSKNRLELAIDQMFHYLSTYGQVDAIATCDNGYVPNAEPTVLEFTKYKVIRAASLEEIAQKCYEMVCSGIALSAESHIMCREFIIAANKTNPDFVIDVNKIKDREFMVQMCQVFNLLPNNPAEVVRYLVYLCTGSTLVIKSKESIQKIKRNACVLSEVLKDYDLKKLAEVFFRFKPLFLAMKSNPVNFSVVNKLRRLANKYHRPMMVGCMESIIDNRWTPEDIKHISKNEDVFSIIRAIGVLSERIDNIGHINKYAQTYVIRNKKSFTRVFDYKYVGQNQKEYWELKRNVLLDELKTRLFNTYNSEKPKTVLLSDRFELTCPVSEKLFMGNYPYGTSYAMKKNNYFGVYWRMEWGTDDFDLSFFDKHGSKLGWNSRFYNDDKSILFSGDMTSANPEAVEMFYCKDIITDGRIVLNRYRGKPMSKARLFFGADNLSGKFCKNYMVDPNTIEMTVDIISDKAESNVGCIIDGRYYCIDIPTFNGRVSKGCDMNEAITEGIRRKLKSFISLKHVLEMAGFNVITSKDELAENETVDFDFTTVDKDTLIKFFSDAKR